MKKLLLTSLVCLGMASIANAESYTYVMADYLPDASIEQWNCDGFTFTTAKNNSTNEPSYNANGKDVRVYAKGSLTISSADVNITSVSFEISAQGQRRMTEITPSVGSIAQQGAYPLVWTGDASSITFTVGDKAIYGSEGETKAGQLDFTAVTIYTNGDVGEVVTPPASNKGVYTATTKVADGNYLLYAESIIATPLTSGYGYLQVVAATPADNAITTNKANQFTIKATDGGYTIQDPDGYYYFMKGDYKSFNRQTEMPEEGGVWSIAINDAGQAVINNVLKNKSIQFDPNYNSFGSYDEVTGIYPVLYVYTKDAEDTPDEPVTPELPVFQSLNVLSDQANNTEFQMGIDLTVVYSNGAYTYVYDGQNYGLIYKYDLGLNAGDVIAKDWKGKVSIYNNLIELVPSTELTVAQSGAAIPQPLEIEGEDASAFLTASNQNVYVLLYGVNFAEATAESGSFTGTMDGVEVSFYQRFALGSFEAGVYNVLGFVSVYKDTVQVYPISIDDPSGICDITAENAVAKYYNLQGVEVANPIRGNVYIKVTGNKATKLINND